MYLKRRLKELGLVANGGVQRTKADCLQICAGGPIAGVWAEGVWYPKAQNVPVPAPLPAPVRIASALKRPDPLDGQWKPLPTDKSLPELGVSDQRYVLYRARFSLSETDAAKFGPEFGLAWERD